jgi:hypothetical protein
MNDMNNGGSYFHQLAVRFSKRMSMGLLVSANFSHSRLMEAVTYPNGGDLTLEKRVSAWDRPNNFSISGLYQLPFGRGKRFLSGAHGIANVLGGDWAVSTLYTFHSGAPVAWGNMIYFGGDLNYDPRNVSHAFDTTRFNPSQLTRRTTARFHAVQQRAAGRHQQPEPVDNEGFRATGKR